jgi:hypothetical protein
MHLFKNATTTPAGAEQDSMLESARLETVRFTVRSTMKSRYLKIQTIYAHSPAHAKIKIREKLKEIRHPRCVVIDVNRETNIANATHNQVWINRLQTQFVNLLQNTKFSLCPRGVGTNSWRLYESMAMGRAPVILSDHWVAPKEIAWEDFSIRIAERDYKIIPEILEEHEHRAQELGLKARQTWEHHFLPNGIFDHAISTFLEIQASGKTKNWHEHQFRRLRMLPKILRLALHATRVRIQRGS